MVVEKLPEVVPPSGRVPGRGLLVLPILEARRRQNRGEIAKKGSRYGVSRHEEYIGEGGSQGGHQGSRRPPGAAPPWGAPGGRLGPWWVPSAPPLGDSGSFLYADFLLEFSQIFGALFIWRKPEIEK